MTNFFGTNHSAEAVAPRPTAEVLEAENRSLRQCVDHLEERLAEEKRLNEELRFSAQQQKSALPKHKKIKFGKIRKFFAAVIAPILVFIPNLINAVANHKKAVFAK